MASTRVGDNGYVRLRGMRVLGWLHAVIGIVLLYLMVSYLVTDFSEARRIVFTNAAPLILFGLLAWGFFRQTDWAVKLGIGVYGPNALYGLIMWATRDSIPGNLIGSLFEGLGGILLSLLRVEPDYATYTLIMHLLGLGLSVFVTGYLLRTLARAARASRSPYTSAVLRGKHAGLPRLPVLIGLTAIHGVTFAALLGSTIFSLFFDPSPFAGLALIFTGIPALVFGMLTIGFLQQSSWLPRLAIGLYGANALFGIVVWIVRYDEPLNGIGFILKPINRLLYESLNRSYPSVALNTNMVGLLLSICVVVCMLQPGVRTAFAKTSGPPVAP